MEAACAALPLVLAVIAYGNTLGHGFVLDDSIIVERWLLSMNDWRSLLQPPAQLEFAGVYYRPLTFATMWFDYWLGGGQPWPFHLTNVVLHAGTTVLVYAFARSIDLDRPVSVTGAALFAVHPIHTESVAWMAGRTDVLSCLLVLAAALAFWAGRGVAAIIASAALLFLAMLAKESSLAGALVLPLAAHLLGKGSARRAWVTVVLALVPYLALRVATANVDTARNAAPMRLEDVGVFLGLYLAKLMAPFRLNGVILEATPVPAYAALSVIVLLLCLWLLLRRSPTPQPRFLLAFLLVTLAPALAPVVYRIASTPFAERYLYLPSVGFCLLMALWLVGAGVPRRVPAWAGATLAAVLVVVGLGLTRQRNRAWADDLSFWQAQVELEPRHWRPLLNVGKMLADRGQVGQAEGVYMRVLPLADAEALPLVLNNLGNVYNATGREAEAQEMWTKAAKADPRYPDPLYNLGVMYWTRGQAAQARGDAAAARHAFDQARLFLAGTLALQPTLAPAHYALGAVAYVTGDPELARRHLEETIRLAPGSREADAARQVLALVK